MAVAVAGCPAAGVIDAALKQAAAAIRCILVCLQRIRYYTLSTWAMTEIGRPHACDTLSLLYRCTEEESRTRKLFQGLTTR